MHPSYPSRNDFKPAFVLVTPVAQILEKSERKSRLQITLEHNEHWLFKAGIQNR